ncbi:coiled-coil domain-containing protein 174 [Acyrthosiphon pisum]|uniref:CCDC174 alpha/beta GRSR domain-containing protein n=1 Tax=Acyrthosiphon pisum TaxID=7029 RepID=A0A8R2A0S1_ACYPI|nr:coiled-coil domain-containing protein 174 [Acyrthosiphon pisum]|eukprot:XP_001943304.2 PREDICTED: coiled-coil domain-containing protein 174 [Acyrthosiphon pisum]
MSKSLDICKASLVSLKAELLRKQDEANKAKSFSGDTFIRPIPGAKTPSCLLQSNEGVEKRNAKDLEEEYTPDVKNSLKKSRDVLTMKAKLYDKLVNGEMVSEQDKTFLVDFKQKVTENKTTYPVSSTKDNVKEQEKSDSDADLDKYDSGADDDWIDYTDFFGRTRRCLKTDLEFFKNRDQRIEKELEPPPPSPDKIKQQTPITAQQFVKEGRNPEEISELVSSDMRREQLRLKWEEEERKLAERTDIHYEDIRFDEVREHGVGYYSFSTDEKERHRQQAELKKLREQTKTTQISVQKLKEKRAAQMAIRLKAIKRRKKEKLGLPIDSSSDEEAPPPKAPSPEVVEEDMDAERAFEKLRKAAHVRPWDHGKDGLQKPLLTQEEWNEKQRAERKPDFAWDYDDGMKVPKSASFNNYRPVDKDEDDEDDDDDDEDMVGPSLDMFVAPSNPNRQSTITSKSFKKFIHNELDDEPVTTNNKPYHDDDSDLDSIPLPAEPRKGAEIAPPPTYEYYGPSGRGPKAKDNFISVNEMQDSISKGFTNAKSMNKHRPVRGIVDDDDDE